jgi:inner membrane protein YidH
MEVAEPQTARSLAEERAGLARTNTGMGVERTVMTAERTLMAWIRTPVSLISFGFSICKTLPFATGTWHRR